MFVEVNGLDIVLFVMSVIESVVCLVVSMVLRFDMESISVVLDKWHGSTMMFFEESLVVRLGSVLARINSVKGRLMHFLFTLVLTLCIHLEFFILMIILCLTMNDWGQVMLHNRSLVHYLDFALNSDRLDAMLMGRDNTVSNLFSNSMCRVQMELLVVDVRV